MPTLIEEVPVAIAKAEGLHKGRIRATRCGGSGCNSTAMNKE
jgi:hypothetical protein